LFKKKEKKMSFFLLTHINNNISYMLDKIKITWENLNDKPSSILINKTLFNYLKKVKTQIDSCPNEWDKYKKYTNPHEYIHSIIPNTKQSVCSLKPLSRSFYKMIEITTLLGIQNELPKSSCQTFHLAEGPGGFIEAVVKMRNNPADTYYGMTLINEQDHNVPGWNKSKYFLEQNKNVIIEYGKDGKGDLMEPENLLDCYDRFHNSMDLITADGGFDFSYDFNNQETECVKLILCQICFAIAMQKVGGTFLIKFFDTFTRISLEMLYLLSTVYEEVYVIKPHTSRHANSEKYVVCKKFRFNPNLKDLVFKFYSLLKDMRMRMRMRSESESESDADAIFSILNIEIPYLYINKVEEYNAIFGQQQIENIYMTLQLIINNRRDKLEMMKKAHIQKCIEWCQRYDIPYHKNILNNNIFLASLLKEK
jgi:23S rRNA U2552 (ribose-2'-O)-methylase RlmE/FtsJ